MTALRRPGSEWARAAVVLVLLAGTAIAFATTERLKLEKTPFDVFPITKAFSPLHRSAEIRLRLHHPHSLTVQIVNSSDHAVATLARDRPFGAGVAVFHWTGRRVRDGVYEPRITLDDGRVYNLPNPIRVDTVPPRVALVSYRPRTIRKRHKPVVHIVYRVSELAHAILFVDGRRWPLFGYAKATHAHVDWQAKENGRRLPRGRYRLQLAAIDLAGNVGPRTGTFIVRIR